MNNRKISKLFDLAGHLLELYGENQFKVRSYEKASDTIYDISTPIIDLNEKELEEIDGVGKALAKKIVQIKNTGSFEDLDKLLQLTPPGIVELVGIKGISPKKVAVLWQTLDILSPEDLLDACKDGMVAGVKGFGEKSQDNLLEVMEFFFESKGKFLYMDAEQDALNLIEKMCSLNSLDKVELTGSIRRKDIIIEKIEILVAKKNNFSEESDLASIDISKNEKGKYVTSVYAIPIELIYSKSGNFIADIINTTGTKAHISRLDKEAVASATNEEEAYDNSGYPYIIPEMREGLDEFETMENISEEDIIANKHLKGCLHNHSKYSDGANTVEEMALRCKELGLEYFGISDHSQTAVYANGLQVHSVLKQFEEIDALNEKLAPFKIFKGIESDILGNGSLDYEEDILKQFDYIVASIHSGLRMNEADATKRLITAIENPYTTILGHMTGRLLLMRAGYPVNHEKIIDACAENGVCIEINANPRRLDIDWKWVHMAAEKGVMLSINPDAHAVREIEYMKYGVYAARKAGLTKDMVLNTLSLSRIEKIFQHKKQSA